MVGGSRSIIVVKLYYHLGCGADFSGWSELLDSIAECCA